MWLQLVIASVRSNNNRHWLKNVSPSYR